MRSTFVRQFNCEHKSRNDEMLGDCQTGSIFGKQVDLGLALSLIEADKFKGYNLMA